MNKLKIYAKKLSQKEKKEIIEMMPNLENFRKKGRKSNEHARKKNRY